MDSMIFPCKYFLVISDTQVDSFLDVLFLLLAVILPELHEKPRGKDWITEKSTWKNLCKEYHFFDCTPFIRCLCFLRLLLPPSQLSTFGMVPIKIYSIALYENLLQFNTSWLTSLKTWHFFRLCFSFSCSGYDLN